VGRHRHQQISYPSSDSTVRKPVQTCGPSLFERRKYLLDFGKLPKKAETEKFIGQAILVVAQICQLICKLIRMISHSHIPSDQGNGTFG
jgi:hypothetical protein